ncbi:unnamed protein product [Arctia plantaginis]|uniref:Uncharacterized protein n=1 Tax=Arctia plantaginis TaxID=874455 RepID=A0A8S1AWT2_ARCPL|nr:unnamed protein product [Arctia plantaginis]
MTHQNSWQHTADMRLWVIAVTLQTLLLSVNCGSHHHRRSMGTQGVQPISKGGWRPVVGSSGLFYGSFGPSQLHSQAYKIPIPVLDIYQSSSRPVLAKDSNKLTSIAQSYRPTTLRTASSAPAVPVANQPINSYYNPFTLQNNAYANYRFVQNYPSQSMVIRNPYNTYADRNIYTKYQNKLNQNNNLQNAMLQQLTNIQPIQFGQYQSVKPLDIFGKPIETYARPNDGKMTQSSNIETFKPEVFKLDNDAAPQFINQQVKTAQQHSFSGLSNIGNPYNQYSFQDGRLPPNILGTFGTFGVQSVKARDPVFPFPTTYGPSQQTKHTIFNSFNYTPKYKTTPNVFDTTTPRTPSTVNQFSFGTTHSDLKNTPTPQTKEYVPPKIDPNADLKDGFKPSPQDPFSNKNRQSDRNKISVTTYNPVVPTTTLSNNYYNYNFPSYQSPQAQVYQDQHNSNFNYEKKKLLQDSITAGNQQPAHVKTNSENAQSPYQSAYEVTEAFDSEHGTQSSPAPWSVTPITYEYNNQQTTEQSEKKHGFVETLSRPGTTFTPDLPEEFAIVTESEKGHGNSLSYDGQVESQSRRPLGDDFEPIGIDKLKDYYYRVSTPVYDDNVTSKRTKPTESAKYTSTQEITTQFHRIRENNTEQQVEALPTLPTTQHYKRPTPASDINDKDRNRKRNKIRRRRPPLANRNKEETSTPRVTTTFSTTEAALTTNAEEVYTIRPRVRTTKSQPNLTTPTVTTDLTTSALPTISPTTPTILKKKLGHRRPIPTSTVRPETTTLNITQDEHKDSQIMKITSRPNLPKVTYGFRNDFTHKQDEKDTPTSDVAVSLSDSLKTQVESEQDFSFHKDVKPIEAKLEPVTNMNKETTTDFYKEETSDYTTTPRSTELPTTERSQRPRLRNKFHRNRLNVKDYRNRLSSTSSTTEKPVENTPKVRFPQRRVPYFDIESETTTERKRFTPKDPRHKIGNGTENNEQTSKTTEKEIHTIRPSRQRQTTTDNTEMTTVKTSSRIRNGQRRPRPPEETTETSSSTTHGKRPLRKAVKDSEVAESVQDITITENGVNEKYDITSERARSESAIMKIADKKHLEPLENLFEHSKRVSDLTLAASKDYNNTGLFKTVSSNSRRIPNYFTIATDDPILPIEAFFPQLNQKKES